MSSIWNNGDGNDTNQAGPGVDETLITEGNADDVNTITQVGAAVHFARTNAPFTRRLRVDTERAVAHVLLGNDTLTTGDGVGIGMNIDAGPGDDTITTGAGLTASSAIAATTRSTARAAMTRWCGPTATATTS